MLLLALPFLDLRRERRLGRRPVAIVAAVLTVISMAVLTWKGATARESLSSEVIADVPNWVQHEALPQKAVPGAKLFASAGCTACHTYLGVGSSNLGAPDLTSIGTRGLGLGFQVRHLACPPCVNPGSPMPKFQSLGNKRLRQLAVFLEASKGKK
jgi:cbb3-type cytochrome oxidase cytochrome c subunit